MFENGYYKQLLFGVSLYILFLVLPLLLFKEYLVK